MELQVSWKPTFLIPQVESVMKSNSKQIFFPTCTLKDRQWTQNLCEIGLWEKLLPKLICSTHFLIFFSIKLKYTYDILTEELFIHTHNVKKKPKRTVQ